MNQIAYFDLPDVGEGLTEAEIVSWKVKVGDTVSVNQIIVEIETAKSLVELPCPFAGTVSELLANEGDTVNVGSHIIAVAVTQLNSAAASSLHDAVTEAIAQVQDTSVEEKPQPNLVGYGVSGDSATRSRRRRAVASTPVVVEAPVATNLIAVVPPAGTVLAKPPVRKLAKDMDVDLSSISGTGPSGEITREDVLAAAKGSPALVTSAIPIFTGDREERIPVKGVRKAVAAAMVQSAFTAPHVSLFTDVDATRTMEYVKRLKNSPDFAGVKVTPLLIVAKAIMWAIKRNPHVNSTWTDAEIIVHHYVNLGIAAATPRGLLVPNIKDD